MAIVNDGWDDVVDQFNQTKQIQALLPHTTLHVDDFHSSMRQGILEALLEAKRQSPPIFESIQRNVHAIGPHELQSNFSSERSKFDKLLGASSRSGTVSFRKDLSQSVLDRSIMAPGATVSMTTKGTALHEFMHQVGYDIVPPKGDPIHSRTKTFLQKFNKLADSERRLSKGHFLKNEAGIYSTIPTDVSRYGSQNIHEWFAESLSAGIEGIPLHHPQGLIQAQHAVAATEHALMQGGIRSEIKSISPIANRNMGSVARRGLAIRSSAPGTKAVARYAEAAGLKGIWQKARNLI